MRGEEIKSSLPRGTMRFMPLADIFIGAIACLLILIIVARQAREQVMQIPQTDYVFSCEKRQQGDEIRPVSIIRQFLPSQKLSGMPRKQARHMTLKDFESALHRMQHQGRLSTRVLLRIGSTSLDHDCGERVRSIVTDLNRRYENEGGAFPD